MAEASSTESIQSNATNGAALHQGRSSISLACTKITPTFYRQYYSRGDLLLVTLSL